MTAEPALQKDGIEREVPSKGPTIPFGPCLATRSPNGQHVISYLGNNISPAEPNVSNIQFTSETTQGRVFELASDPSYHHLHRVDHQIFRSAVEYFFSRGTEWCNLPLSTRMISSPGEVFAGQTLDYTTDTLPICLKWFDHPDQVFLAESSQFYLELRLLMKEVEEVFCIYSSFRKEAADFSHLSEFQHIEFEGKVDFEENIRVAEGLLRQILIDQAKHCHKSLEYYRPIQEIEAVLRSVEPNNFETVTFKEALKLLREDTGDDRYKEFSLKHFGSWEEVRLTQLTGRNTWVVHYPVLEIPFYHNRFGHDVDGVPVAENADLILYGYREVIGSGVRIASPEVLAEKAKIFNLPLDCYAPYLESRDVDGYRPTAGFGLGWQRLTHWLLKLPAIWNACHVPRGHTVPTP